MTNMGGRLKAVCWQKLDDNRVRNMNLKINQGVQGVENKNLKSLLKNPFSGFN